MSREGKVTTNHQEIRKWVEKRGGKPATVADTQRKGEEAGLLRIDMPGGASNHPVEPISWDDFFAKFDEEELAFLYQDQTAEGEESHFCKFVSRESSQKHAKR